MNQSTLFWKEYINLYCIEKGQTGLTISNIIGSVRLNTSLKEYSIEDFFTEIVNEKFEILISSCNDIDELVIGKFKNWNAPKTYYQNIDSIYFSKNDFQIVIKELNDLALELKKRYNNRIESGTYSKNGQTNKWVYLTEEDMQNHLIVNEKLTVK
ncbi:hypothetical protein [Zobellia uliginosa]|uniref:hypothetical protein n=1 Tax=Zobellia uliginosa TaxID=143224 RepID=UPI0026E1828E|nr:hypothetical protein [Zobellia uliginosa]MDO6517740.1 hypothetical protein [Zobellia uliginosa]